MLFVEGRMEAFEISQYNSQYSVLMTSKGQPIDRNNSRQVRHGRRKNNKEGLPYSQLNRWDNGKAESAAYTINQGYNEMEDGNKGWKQHFFESDISILRSRMRRLISLDYSTISSPDMHVSRFVGISRGAFF